MWKGMASVTHSTRQNASTPSAAIAGLPEVAAAG